MGLIQRVGVQRDLFMKQVFSGSFQRAALILALWAGWIGAAEAAERRPNFMIIIADDLCWRDTGYEGQPRREDTQPGQVVR